VLHVLREPRLVELLKEFPEAASLEGPNGDHQVLQVVYCLDRPMNPRGRACNVERLVDLLLELNELVREPVNVGLRVV
jgi:hypothetical protein